MNAKHRKIIIVVLLGGCLISCSLVSCSKDEMKEQQLEIRSQLESAVADIDREIDRIRRQTETTADTAKEKPKEGKVIALGDGRILKSGQRAKFQIKKGDRVLFSSYGGTEVRIDGEDYLLMSEDDILAVIE